MSALKLAELAPADAERLAGKFETWDGNCHGVSAALAPALGGVVRRGYWLGTSKPGAFFHEFPALQHSWIELADGTFVDPTRHAFTLDPLWPLYVVPDEERDLYDIGGCRSQPAEDGHPYPASRAERLITLPISRADLESTGLGLVLQSWQWGEGVAHLSEHEVSWLANLPIKDVPQLGSIPRENARAIYQALVDANRGGLIPIDRRDWILEDGGALYGRPE